MDKENGRKSKLMSWEIRSATHMKARTLTTKNMATAHLSGNQGIFMSVITATMRDRVTE